MKIAIICLLLGNVALSNAQVTIGSRMLPQATLDIIGDTARINGKAFRLIDGNEGAGKVLTCQENGIGIWQYVALHRVVGIKPPDTQPSLQFRLAQTDILRQTGASITLPPGKWEVRVNTLISIADVSPGQSINLTANDFAWVRSTFSDYSTVEGPTSSVVTSDIVLTESGRFMSGRVSGPKNTAGQRLCFGLIQGAVIINNTGTVDKTYHYVAGFMDSNSNFAEDRVVVRINVSGGESSIIATPIL